MAEHIMERIKAHGHTGFSPEALATHAATRLAQGVAFTTKRFRSTLILTDMLGIDSVGLIQDLVKTAIGTDTVTLDQGNRRRPHREHLRRVRPMGRLFSPDYHMSVSRVSKAIKFLATHERILVPVPASQNNPHGETYQRIKLSSSDSLSSLAAFQESVAMAALMSLPQERFRQVFADVATQGLLLAYFDHRQQQLQAKLLESKSTKNSRHAA